MKKIPTYIVTGFLGSGKTHLIERMTTLSKKSCLILQFEQGEERLSQEKKHLVLSFSEKRWKEEKEVLIEEIFSFLDNNSCEELWIEWNGILDFSLAESCFLGSRLQGMLSVEKVLYLSDALEERLLLQGTGGSLVSQLLASDIGILKDRGSQKEKAEGRSLLKGVSKGISLFEASKVEALETSLVASVYRRKQKKERNIAFLSLMLAGFLLFSFLWGGEIPVISQILSIFIGTFLQGLPFLVVGILLSSGIQLFLSTDGIVSRFPKHPFWGMLVGLVSGFFLPVCDCASIPVFKSLLKKGVPPAAAICFLCASPVINPVVILSTYYAFGFRWSMVFWRIGLGVLCGFLIGLFFLRERAEDILRGNLGIPFLECGREGGPTTQNVKFFSFWNHSRVEFFQVVPYLMVGILCSSIFQVLNLSWLQAFGRKNLLFSILALLLFSFLLSLCSSSDAVVARGMEGLFPRAAILGFLVFGPMLDVKNIFLLKGYVSTRFLLRLACTIFLVCFCVVFFFARWMGGR